MGGGAKTALPPVLIGLKFIQLLGPDKGVLHKVGEFSKCNNNLQNLVKTTSIVFLDFDSIGEYPAASGQKQQ